LPITTAKDAVRIPQSLRDNIAVCDVEIIFQDADALLTTLVSPSAKVSV
jgi:tetraacyldisaccharide-1-P 4'-kinase